MRKSIFITGTGTDVGKTYVSGLLAKHLVNIGEDCAYYKPVLSGAGDALQAGDCEFVINMAGLKQAPLDSVSYIFGPSVSPHLAARLDDIVIDEQKILADYKSKSNDYLIVEGAGGITCPLRADYLMSNLIVDLNIPVILVADAGLGMINFTLLTVEYARARNIDIKGIILNRYLYEDIMYEDNLKTVEKLCNVPVIALVKSGGDDIEFLIDNVLEVFE